MGFAYLIISVVLWGAAVAVVLLIYRHWYRPMAFHVFPYALVILSTLFLYLSTDVHNALLGMLVFAGVVVVLHWCGWYEKNNIGEVK